MKVSSHENVYEQQNWMDDQIYLQVFWTLFDFILHKVSFSEN